VGVENLGTTQFTAIEDEAAKGRKNVIPPWILVKFLDVLITIFACNEWVLGPN
jgi:hypothetical protein